MISSRLIATQRDSLISMSNRYSLVIANSHQTAQLIDPVLKVRLGHNTLIEPASTRLSFRLELVT